MKKLLITLIFAFSYMASGAQISQTFKNVTVLDTLKTGSDSMLFIKADLIPQSDSSFDIGNDTLRWNKIYADTIDANVIDGVTYPDSSVLFVGSDGKPTTDSANFAWDGGTLFILNKANAITGTGGLILTGSSSTQTRITSSTHTNSATNGAQIQLARSLGSVSVPLVPINGTNLGQIIFSGYTGSSYPTTAGIFGMSGGTFTSTSNPVYLRMTMVDANGSLYNTVFTQKGTFSIKGTNADTTYDLTVNGTAAITTTPEIAVGGAGVSFLVTDATTQVQSMPFAEGVYLPVDSAGSNVDGVTPDTAFYTRVGNIVTVSGVVEIDPTTTATPTFFYVNLPIFPANWSTNRAGGTFAAYIVNESGAILMGGPTSVLFQYNPTATGANNFSYTYSYRIE